MAALAVRPYMSTIMARHRVRMWSAPFTHLDINALPSLFLIAITRLRRCWARSPRKRVHAEGHMLLQSLISVFSAISAPLHRCHVFVCAAWRAARPVPLHEGHGIPAPHSQPNESHDLSGWFSQTRPSPPQFRQMSLAKPYSTRMPIYVFPLSTAPSSMGVGVGPRPTVAWAARKPTLNAARIQRGRK